MRRVIRGGWTWAFKNGPEKEHDGFPFQDEEASTLRSPCDQRNKRETQGMTGNEVIKAYFFVRDVILYIENPRTQTHMHTMKINRHGQ